MIAFPFAASRGEGNKRWQQVCPVGHGRSTVGAGRKDECLQRGKRAARASASAAEFAAGHAEADTCVSNCF